MSKQHRSPRTITAAIGSLLLGWTVACSSSTEPVDPELLAPRLLDDEAELAAYLEAFPSEQYEVHRVPGLGSFYVDNPNDLIKRHLVTGLVWERDIVRHLQEQIRPGSAVVDVGAHIGTHAMTMSRAVGPPGTVYAFEPQKKIFRELVKNLELNQLTNVTPLRFALGSHSAIIEMDPTDQDNEGRTSVGAGGDEVELRTLDSFQLQNVSLIKIDVEGFEDQVIAGSQETIRRCRPVLVVEILSPHNYDWARS
jgi:FkbM family methyltransferase